MPDFGSAAVLTSARSGEATQSTTVEGDPFDDYLRRAQDFIDSGRIDSEEIDYKLKTGEDLGRARDAVLSGDSKWPLLVEEGLTTKPNDNLSDWRDRNPRLNWFKSQPDDALHALRALWVDDDTTPGERIRAFSTLAPEDQSHGGVGSRLRTISVLLMALGPEYPPFKITEFDIAYNRTGYPGPPADADEGAMYEHALAFLDRLVVEAKSRGLTRPSNRLEAQSVVYRVGRQALSPDQGPEDDNSNIPKPEAAAEQQPIDTPDLDALADELLFKVGFLRDIEKLLDDKRQIIFQGPPGTGKTFVARKLAACLAGSPERVRLVQFHPSYAYEDFVQGFRPALRNGQPGFELRPGPLLKMAERAREKPDAKHFLVIDEINRGNLAKVFGELYFLLEYRDEPMQLQYSNTMFSLPDEPLHHRHDEHRRPLHRPGGPGVAPPVSLRGVPPRQVAGRRAYSGGGWTGTLLTCSGSPASLTARTRSYGGDSEAAIGPSYFMRPGLDDEQVPPDLGAQRPSIRRGAALRAAGAPQRVRPRHAPARGRRRRRVGGCRRRAGRRGRRWRCGGLTYKSTSRARRCTSPWVSERRCV